MKRQWVSHCAMRVKCFDEIIEPLYEIVIADHLDGIIKLVTQDRVLDYCERILSL